MRGFYINLDARTERRAEIEKELEGFDVERFPAISHEQGLAGCAMSHIACLKLAKERGYPEVLIFEDDFMWLGDRQIPALPLNQDVCCLAHNTAAHLPMPLQGLRFQSNRRKWVRAKNIQTTSGQIVHAKMQDMLIDCWEDGLRKLLDTGEFWQFALDQHWKSIQGIKNFQVSTPRLGKQRASQSDIEQKFVEQDA